MMMTMLNVNMFTLNKIPDTTKLSENDVLI